MKKIFIIFAAVMLFTHTYAAGEEIGDGIYSELQALDSQIEGFSFYDFASGLKNGEFSEDDFIKKLINAIGGDLLKNLRTILFLIVPIILFTLLSNLSVSGSEGAVKSARLIVYVFIAITAFSVFSDMLTVTGKALFEINAAAKCMVPVLFSLYIFGGNPLSGAVIKPTLFITSQLFNDLLLKVFFPLITLNFALVLSDNILNTGRLKYFGELIGKFVKWSMVFTITLYMSLVTTANLAGDALSGLKLKSAKFAVATFVPIVGGALADGVEAATASVKLIKSTVGAAGIFGIIYIALIPIIKIYTVVFGFWVLASLTEPLGEKSLADLIQSIGNTISQLGVLVICMAFVFLIFSATVLKGG